MLFTSPEFWLFVLGVWSVHALCPARWRWLPLLVASYLFYGLCDWRYTSFLAAITTVNFAVGLAMGKPSEPSRRRRLLIVGIVVSLVPLMVLKYTGFALGALSSLLSLLHIGDGAAPVLQFLLPVGISFYTFQALNYTIDVYRGTLTAERHVGRFALYVAFFPQLLAGPIGRASTLLAQYQRGGVPSYERLASGAQLILWGLFQKMVVADRLAIYVDKVYAEPSAFSAGTLLLACYFFTFQIYCDFAGYSNIAIGVARLLGYDLMQNFRLPYFAASITEFWRRWHISLTSWFRDYVYIPLGGNRVSLLRWTANIMMVFLLSGLWHGANWTFLIWGGMHGLCYLVERACARRAGALRWPRGLKRLVGMILTFHIVALAWVFFRAPSMAVAADVLRGVCSGPIGPLYRGSSQLTTLLSFVFLAVLLAVEWAQARGWASLHASPSRCPRPVRWGGYIALILAVAIFGISSRDFVYFQF